MSRLRLCLPLLFASSLVAQTSGQTNGQTTGQTPTLHATARIVVVDVVVLDGHGNAVHGLKQSDFILSEAKTPQTIRNFEEHSVSSTPVKTAPLPPMPPGVFTNYVATPANSTALNILLLDTLNTPMQDQTYVRTQMLKYLKTARPGTNMAIFGLTTRLIQLQGFTTDPELLRTAVTSVKAKSSPLLLNPGGVGAPASAADQYDELSAGLSGLPNALSANLHDFDAEQKSFDITQRVGYTLAAMNQLARYLASLPGRKNLIWFSGSFPINIMPDADAKGSAFAGMASSQDVFRETTNLLTRSQVAVYPIDAIGVRTDQTNNADAGDSSHVQGGDQRGATLLQDNRSFTYKNFDDHETMKQMAGDTGGKAYINTNDFAQSVNSAINDGANYYTLSYTPSQASAPDAYRSIRVEVDGASKYKLTYRHGYYAEAANSTKAALAAPAPSHIHAASMFGAPAATEIIFNSNIRPVTSIEEPAPFEDNTTPAAGKGPWIRYVIGYNVLGRQINFTATPDGVRHGAVQFLALVYNADGILANTSLNSIYADFTPAQYDSMLHSGLPHNQQISVPAKGNYTLRLLVLDQKKNHIGATEIPVAAIKNLPPLTASSTAPPK